MKKGGESVAGLRTSEAMREAAKKMGRPFERGEVEKATQIN